LIIGLTTQQDSVTIALIGLEIDFNYFIREKKQTNTLMKWQNRVTVVGYALS
jgi:hypothetical protein